MAASTFTRVTELPKDVQELLSEHGALTYDAKKNKVCCRLSGHEMPCAAEAIRSYVKGKKYNKLRHEAQYDHSHLSQHIVPNTKRGLEHLLFCKLTLRHINNCPADIDIHVRGRRFKRELARWENCQKTGETFKPLASLKQKGPSTSWDRPQKKGAKGSNSDSEQEEDDNQSDLSDLYPDADFAVSEDEDESGIEDARGDNENIRGNNEDDRMIMDGESDSDSEFEDMDMIGSTMDADCEPGSSKNRTVTKSGGFTKISDFNSSDRSKSAARKRPSRALKQSKLLSGLGRKRKKMSQT